MKIKEKAVLLWLSNRDYIQLKKYSKKWNTTISDAIRRAIINLTTNEK